MININNKPWSKLRSTDIQKFLSGTEDENFFFEFKADEETPAKLVKEISAFANTYALRSAYDIIVTKDGDVKYIRQSMFLLKPVQSQE